MQKLTIDDVAEFIWFWDETFFLETKKGNFVWNDPDHGGDNTITPYKGSVGDFCRKINADFGRDKGVHKISEYCGPDVKICD
jgi:hypothetical protein